MTDERQRDAGHDNDNDEGKPLLPMIDLDQWEAQSPPSDFAERVLTRVRAEEKSEKSSPKRRRWLVVGVSTLAVAAVALLGIKMSGPPSHGEAIAKDSIIEVPIGSRALAVLEPGANVKWNGDDVEQPTGDVFYRVEPGARFTVHTPAGNVEVKGTCFTVKVRPSGAGVAGVGGNQVEDGGSVMQKRDFKAGAIGAGLSALAFVAVYEGKVAVSHASERVDLRAGETAQTGPDGVKLTGAAGVGERAFDAKVAANEANSDDPTDKANQNLVRQVSDYRSRLDALSAQKTELEAKLKKSEENLAASQDGSRVAIRHDFDLSNDDWKDLAKDGTIKFQMPCVDTKNGGWSPNPEKLQTLGLAPSDAAPIKAAYNRSSQRVWGQIKPLCAAAVGNADVAERIGADTCIHLVLDTEQDRDNEATKAARRQVGEIRAGTRPMPAANEQMHPIMKLFLATTGASKAFEDDLAQTFGPEEAHRLVYADELCMGSSVFGGGRRKK